MPTRSRTKERANRPNAIRNAADVTSPSERVRDLLDQNPPPKSLFGDDDTYAKQRYRTLAQQCHPDHGGDPEVFARLNRLWDAWNNRPVPKTVVIETKRHTYVLGDLIGRGDICNVYNAKCAFSTGLEMSVVLKMPRSPIFSDRLVREANTLKVLTDEAPKNYRAFYPYLSETFRHRDQEFKKTRQVNVFEPLAGFVSLAQVRTIPMYRDGLDARDLAWIWRRLLVAVGVANDAGIVHGAIAPEHVLIHPEDHGVVLIDWCYSVESGQPLQFATKRYMNWMAPEALAKQPVTAASDVWMLNQVMAHMLHHDAPAQFRAFIRGNCAPEPRARLSAKESLGQLNELLERLYGPLRFRRFMMPTST